jgi:hypothetical protein
VPEVGSVVGLVRGYRVAVDGPPMDLGAKVRKGFVQKVVHAILIWCGIRLRCVVDEVIGKQFVEQRALVLPRTTVGITEASAGHHRQTMTERDDEPRQRRGILVGGQVTQHCFPVGQARRAGA